MSTGFRTSQGSLLWDLVTTNTKSDADGFELERLCTHQDNTIPKCAKLFASYFRNIGKVKVV